MNEKTISFTIPKPIDAHVHLRDGDMLQAVAPFTSRQFSYAVVMPNLLPPVVTAEQALGYKNRIEKAAGNNDFTALMTLYLTDNIPPSEIKKAIDAGVAGVKYYPAGATTNSDSGVTDVKKTYPVLKEMEKHNLPLLVHGEVTDKDVDVFDREKIFIERILTKIRKDFPDLRIVLEHITTKEGVDFVNSEKNVYGTLTAHHLLFNRNEIFRGGIRPHYYCLPILKREEHRLALVKAATSGSDKFFAGTDSAPHAVAKKENSCGCAGCFTAANALELYAMAFDSGGEFPVERFTDFMYNNALKFYGLKPVSSKVTLTKKPSKVIESVGEVIPLLAGEEIGWQVL